MIRVPKVNLHTHTTYCDGKESVESMIQAAIAKDFIRLGFSGHVFNDFRPEDQDIWCMSPERTQKYSAEVRAMAEKYKDKIDILCGGSQKALSAPPGLTMVWVSDRAYKAMEERKVPIASFYCNILNFREYYENQWFPYTMPISDIYGLREALDAYFEMEEDIYVRHDKIAAATRKAVAEAGLGLYVTEGWAQTVTAIEVPEGTTDKAILEMMEKEHNIMISGCFDVLAGKVLRIGHMGENAREEKVAATLAALQATLEKLGVTLKCNMEEVFNQAL